MRDLVDVDLSHMTTVAYALAVAADPRLVAMFAANALSSATIVRQGQQA